MISDEERKNHVIYWLEWGGRIYYNPDWDPPIPKMCTGLQYPGVFPMPLSVFHDVLGAAELMDFQIDDNGKRMYYLKRLKGIGRTP
jgi:hypothetical protein